jgi:hypothetical protein
MFASHSARGRGATGGQRVADRMIIERLAEAYLTTSTSPPTSPKAPSRHRSALPSYVP